MRNPRELYELTDASVDLPRGLRLVAGLTGFADAGNAVSQLGTALLDGLEHEAVAVFDNDALLDYRARRPVISFSEDHISDYRPPQLTLHLMWDELHRPFLFLHGYEPDFEWEAFTTAMIDLVDTFEVESITWVHSIPMPVPHTRPIRVTVSGTRKDLVEQLSVWRPHTQAPATAMHLLEYRLQEAGLETVGFVLLVPHYLADTEYPAAVLAALENISIATGLIFPSDELRDEERDFLSNIDDQVANNGELARLVSTLEERHDSYMQDSPAIVPSLSDESGQLPTADELAAELEKFLAHQRHRSEDEGSD